MRSPSRKLQNLWFCEVTETNDGVSLKKTYGKPVKRRFRVCQTMGYVRGTTIGLNLLYDRYVDCYDRNFNPPEGTAVFVDVIPQIGSDGYLATEEVAELNLDGTPMLDENDEPITRTEYVTLPDYYIKRVLDTKKGVVARFVLEKE